MDDLKALPIACTLSPHDLRDRLGLIQALTRDSLKAYERDGLNLTLHYAAEATDRVRDMVAGEQHCCAFLRFDVRNDKSGVHVTIQAPEHAREAADELFAQFIDATDVTMTR